MTKPTIDEILDEMERLDKTAPPAPWTAFPCHYAHPNRGGLSHDTFKAWAVDSSGPDEDHAVACFDDCREEDQQAAAKLTAYIRNHVPTLVAEIRRLRQRFPL
jgi:hypothetical protein